MGGYFQLEHLLRGIECEKQAYYQFGAKLHEMTAQASITAIVFSYVRYELSIGMYFSGLSVSKKQC